MIKPYRFWREPLNRRYSVALIAPTILASNHPLFLAAVGLNPAIYKAINVAIFVGILYFLLRKPVRQFFANRYTQVRETLERAAKEKEIASAKLSEIDARLNRLDVELAEIRKESLREAAAEKKRIEAETMRDIEKLRQMSQREIEASKQMALADLREFAAGKAVDLAERIIRRELRPEDDARLLRRVGDELGQIR